MNNQRLCNKCGQVFPATKEYFGHQPNRDLRRVCRECERKRVREYSRQNPDVVQERARRRQEQSKQAEGEFTEIDILRIRNKLKDTCYYCGEDLEGGGEIDHKIPIARGGTHFPSNLTLACCACNKEKHSKTVEEYKQWRVERNLHIIPRNF